VNRADGISEIEDNARAAASEQGRERVSNSPATPKQAKAGVSKASLKKSSVRMSSLIARFRLWQRKANHKTKRKRKEQQ
jgi:hypothetical protein